jgi:hypothetical protein
MLHNNRSRRPEPETPPPSSVQDYLARKYAALGIDPPEPIGHQPGHIPETLTDERSDVGHPEGEQRSDLANATPEAGRPKPVAAPAPKPLTRDQRTALDLLDRGLSVTEIMDTLGHHRQTFYDWGKANPTFAHAAESARDNRRGVLVDSVHDLQLAALSLVGNYIRSDNSPDSIRLRAASLVFRHAHSETLLPRRILATFTAPDGISQASPLPDNLDPLNPPHEDPGGPGTEHIPTESEQRSDLAHSTPEANADPSSMLTPNASDGLPQTLVPEQEEAVPPNDSADPASASATICAEKSSESVRSVRFENAQSTSATDEPTPSEIRTPNVSDGFPPSPERERRVPAETSVPSAPIPTAEGANTDASSSDERSDVASAPSQQRSDLSNSSPDPGNRTPEPGSPKATPVTPPAPPQKPRKPETMLADAYLSATFLHKHEPRAAFETLLKHHMGAYAPATPQEELLTFRITQKSWILRRLDTFDRVISDSAVTKIRENHPNAAPAACIAMTFLTRNDTEETSFYARIAQQRKDQEAALDRLEAKLQTLQTRREERQDRREAREDSNASAARKHQSTVHSIPLPFQPNPHPAYHAARSGGRPGAHLPGSAAGSPDARVSVTTGAGD